MFMNAHASVQWYAIECKCVASGSAGAAAVAAPRPSQGHCLGVDRVVLVVV